MAQISYLWTTSSSGDGSSTYSRADWAAVGRVFAACSGYQGVGPSYLNELEGSVTGANTVAINTGGAVVDGKPYVNDASVNVNIPSAVGGGNTRIDRIVLRASWSAQTVRITRIAGTDASSPTAPAITQTSGTTYDINLYRATVNTSGTVTIVDERVWAIVATDDSTLEHSAGTLRVKDAGIVLAKLAADSVDDTKAGNRIPQFYRRQGGSATNWDTAGTTSRTPGAVRMQAGKISLGNMNPGNEVTAAITFPTAFSDVPLVYATAVSNGLPIVVTYFGQTASGMSIDAFHVGASGGGTITVSWFAIGPE